MARTTEPYEVTVTGEIYRVAHEDDEGTTRIVIYSRGRLRFSLQGGTPPEQVQKFIQVYALGFVDGQNARSTAVEDHVRGRLNLAARRLGQAFGKLKASGERPNTDGPSTSGRP
jgi:hypothetical protein